MPRLLLLLAEFWPALPIILGTLYFILQRQNEFAKEWQPLINLLISLLGLVFTILGIAVALNWLNVLKAPDQTPQTAIPSAITNNHEWAQTHLSVRTCPKVNETCLIKGILESGSKVKVFVSKNTTIVESDGTKTPWTYIELVSGKVCSLTDMANRSTCSNWQTGISLNGWVNYTKLSTTSP